MGCFAQFLNFPFMDYLVETKQYHILSVFKVFQSDRICDLKDLFYRKDTIPMISEIFLSQSSAKYCDLVSRVLERSSVYKLLYTLENSVSSTRLLGKSECLLL